MRSVGIGSWRAARRSGPVFALLAALAAARWAWMLVCGSIVMPVALGREAPRQAREYTELSTPHFTLLSTEEPARAREFAQRLWAFRVALESLLGARLDSAVPVTIFALRGEDWRRYAEPRTGLAGWFSAQPYAVDLMFDASAGSRLALELTLHEYTHHLLRALGPAASRLPPFLDEGLAELFGSARFGSRRLRFAPRPDHLALLRTHDWLPFERVLEVGRRDPEYVEHGTARTFYAQAWATAFFVVGSGDARRPGSGLAAYLATLRELDDGLDAETRARLQRRAAEALLGRSVDEANAAVARFVLRAGPGLEVMLPLPRAALEPVPATIRRVGQHEYDLRLAEMMLRLGNRAVLARTLFRTIPDSSPLAPRARVGAALAVLQSGERPFAAALLDDPALASGLDAATRVRLARGLLQLGLPSDGERSAQEGEARLRRGRLERARSLFAASLGAAGVGAEATWGYVVATLSLGGREPDLLDRAIQAYATAPGNPDLAVAVALAHEAEGHEAEARRFWSDAARNLRPGPERDRMLARITAGSPAAAPATAEGARDRPQNRADTDTE